MGKKKRQRIDLKIEWDEEREEWDKRKTKNWIVEGQNKARKLNNNNRKGCKNNTTRMKKRNEKNNEREEQSEEGTGKD